MISIITPCYATSSNNHGILVQRAVQSALRQRVEKEIIVVDDGSPEPVRNIWGRPVRVIRHDQNQGLSAALNTGIHLAKGDRFIIVSSDDELRADALEKMATQNADVVCSDFQPDKGNPVKCEPATLDKLLNVGNCHSYAALMRKSLWETLGGYKITMNPSWEDYEFFINAAKHKASWAYIPEPLHIYHRNPTGRDADAQDKLRLLRGKLHGYHPDLFGPGVGLVTFIIPCYKQEHWLPEALTSIFAQIYPHVNAVVVDDGSPGDVVKAAASVMGDTHVIRQHNKHLSSARNTGIRYALDKFNPEYMVMLDADDMVAPTFVEELMAFMSTNNREYIYSDIKLAGDAWHDYVLHDYNPRLLAKKHVHACTFLAPSAMYLDVINGRGYAYDENMKKGYEDWEFALASLKAGWCGRRYPKTLFHYRYHNGGSMRMEAEDINDELAAYIRARHTWIYNPKEFEMACASCGGRSVSTRVVSKNGGLQIMVNVPGIGSMDGREPIRVTYGGGSTSIMTKIGVAGTIYKYSAEEHRMVDGSSIGRDFPAFARDAHLFSGPFQIQRMVVPEITPVVSPQPMAVAAVEKLPNAPVVDPLIAKYEARQQMPVLSLEPDDFTQLAGIGPAYAEKLVNAGFAYYQDIADASPEEIALVLGASKTKAAAIIQTAATKVG